MPHSKISRDWIKIFVGPDPCHEEEGPGPKGVLCPIQKYSGIDYSVEHPILWFYNSLNKDNDSRTSSR